LRGGGAEVGQDQIAARIDAKTNRIAAAVLDNEAASGRRLHGDVLRGGVGEKKRSRNREGEQGRMLRVVARHVNPQRRCF